MLPSAVELVRAGPGTARTGHPHIGISEHLADDITRSTSRCVTKAVAIGKTAGDVEIHGWSRFL